MDKFKPTPTLETADIAYVIDSVDPSIQPSMKDRLFVPPTGELDELVVASYPLPSLEEMVLAEAKELAEILELLENIEQAKEVILQKKQDLSNFLCSTYFSLDIPEHIKDVYGVKQKIEKYAEPKESKATRGRPKKNKTSEPEAVSPVGIVVPSITISGTPIEGFNTINDHEGRKFTEDAVS
jgi:hypothetical protein